MNAARPEPSRDGGARALTRGSGSNLAAAFFLLPASTRRDMTTFYAFCRRIDDIADDPSAGGTAERRAALERWRGALTRPVDGEDPLAAPLRELLVRRGIDTALPGEILDGVGMDIEARRYTTFDELREYCHRVAGAVGLVSIEIFGCKDPRCREYAEALGLALQLTNILRDVGVDWRNGGRVYFPLEDMNRFRYGIDELAAGTRDARFLALMEFEAVRAERCFAQARTLLPRAERRRMIAAEMMGAVYRRLLDRLRRERFPVFDRVCRLGKTERVLVLLGAALRCVLPWRGDSR